MKTLTIAIFLAAIVSPIAYGQEEKESNSRLVEVLILAKGTGMCGALKQLLAFQESTKMPGGDEFVMRFLQAEAARLGQTTPDFLAQCKSTVDAYTGLMSSLQN